MKITEFQLERYFAQHEFSTRYILCSSDNETFSVQDVLALEPDARDRLLQMKLGYTESPGHPRLREEIANLYDTVGADDVLVFTGAEEGIFAAMNVLLKPGDHIIVHFPAYQSLFAVAEAIGCEVTRLVADEAHNWAPDPQSLRDSIRSETKVIIVNFPHNPTGFLASGELQEEIRSIAEEKGIFLFSDEVYRYSEYDPADRLPALCDVYENGCSLGVMSKTFGLAGLRIGWLASKNKEFLQKAARFKDYTTITNSGPAELLAETALRHKEHFIRRNGEIIRHNLLLVDAFFEKHRSLFSWVKPKAGGIAFPKILFDMSTDEFAARLIKEKEVLLLPSSNYLYDDRHFRIGFSRKNMPEALALLDEFVCESIVK